jgi:hypothetical protein
MYSKILVVPADNRCFAENFWRSGEGLRSAGMTKYGRKRGKTKEGRRVRTVKKRVIVI